MFHAMFHGDVVRYILLRYCATCTKGEEGRDGEELHRVGMVPLRTMSPITNGEGSEIRKENSYNL